MTEITANPKQTYALVVGIDAYKDPDLNREKLVNHAIDFAKWLRDKDVPGENIFLCLSPLEDNKSSVQQLVKELEIEYREATQQTLFSLLTEKLREKEGDLLFTFWVGHGLIDSEGKRRLFYADATIDNGNYLIIDTLLKSQKSNYFQIQNHICIIDACASYVPESVRPLCLGGQEVPLSEPSLGWKQFILFSAREGESSETCPEQKTSYFCEALHAELKGSKSSTTWLPNMEVIASKLKARFEDLRKQGKVEQIPNYVNVQTWDGDEKTLFKKDASADLYENVKKYADAAREGLNPSIFKKRITRPVIDDKYLPAIKRGVKGNIISLIPIIGPAGYGKSVILGNIYDVREQFGAGWVALVRCDDLILPNNLTSKTPEEAVDQLAEAIGQAVSGKAKSIINIASRLTNKYKTGVLLIDTLDLVLDEDFVKVFRQVLLKLMDTGTTVVFTCRVQDFNEFLEPRDKKLTGLASRIDDYKQVPGFTPKEIEEAVLYFFQNQQKAVEEGEAFVNRIKRLSADNKHLDDITRNPLLLGLLCEVFALDGDVIPPDLTVSKLYNKYWEKKISSKNRKEYPSNFNDTEGKEDRCLGIAKVFFNKSMSEKKFYTTIPLRFLKFNSDKDVAYIELRSESILREISSKQNPLKKIEFFHQTFLEYVIALWLFTDNESQASKNQLLDAVTKSNAAQSLAPMWAVIRQLLAIDEFHEFERISKLLDKRQIQTFRVVAFAAASRDENELSECWRELKDIALAQGEEYQKKLLDALESTPASQAEKVLPIALILLQESSGAVAENAVLTVGRLIIRLSTSIGFYLEQAFQAIEKLATKSEENNANERTRLYGQLVTTCRPKLEQNSDTEVLFAFRKRYSEFGSEITSLVLNLHVGADVSEEAQRELVIIILQDNRLSKSKQRQLRKNTNHATNLFDKHLPSLVGKSRYWNNWMQALYDEQLPEGWEVVIAKSVGRQAAKDSELLAKMRQDFIEGDINYIRRNLVSIREAVRNGSGNLVTSTLLNTSIESFHQQNRLNSVAQLLRELFSIIEHNQIELLVEWIKPMLDAHLDKLRPILKVPIIKKILSDSEQPVSNKHSSETDSNSQSSLIEVYCVQARNSDEQAILQLLRMSIRSIQTLAQEASEVLAEIAGYQDRPNIEDLLQLANSPIPGVRLNSLKALIQMMERGFLLQDSELTILCNTLSNESSHQVLLSYFQLVARWIRAIDNVSLFVVQAIGNMTMHLLKEKKLTGDMANWAITALKTIAEKPNMQIEKRTLILQLIEWSSTILCSINLNNVPNGPTVGIEIIKAVTRLESKYLSTSNFLSTLANYLPSLPKRNRRVVIAAIADVKGSKSDLLDHILASDWCPDDVKNLILNLRGQ